MVPNTEDRGSGAPGRAARGSGERGSLVRAPVCVRTCARAPRAPGGHLSLTGVAGRRPAEALPAGPARRRRGDAVIPSSARAGPPQPPPIGRPLLPDPPRHLRGRRFLLGRGAALPAGAELGRRARTALAASRAGGGAASPFPFLRSSPARARRGPRQTREQRPRPAAESGGCGGARGCCSASPSCGCWASPTTCTRGAAPRWPRARAAAPAGR